MKWLITMIICGLILFPIHANAQVVSPLQGGHYIPGVANIRDRATPPPGLFVIWYNAIASSDTYIDRNGDEFNSIRLSELYPRLPDIDVDVELKSFASIPTVFWASNKRILGGARYLAGASINYINADASIFTERGGIIIDTVYTKEFSSRNSGLSDLFIVPVGLSWSREKYEFTFMYGIYTPTGRYKTGAENTLGLGFTTHQFQGFNYFYPKTDKSTAFMLGLTFEVNSAIKDADVKPGNRFSLDWGISQYLSPRFEINVRGGNNWQIADDSGDDVYWDSTVHDRKSNFLFGASYWLWNEHLSLSVNYGFEYGIRQRFKNNTWLINLVFVPGILTGKE